MLFHCRRNIGNSVSALHRYWSRDIRWICICQRIGGRSTFLHSISFISRKENVRVLQPNYIDIASLVDLNCVHDIEYNPFLVKIGHILCGAGKVFRI